MQSYLYYSGCGVIVHPLTPPREGYKSPGKGPVIPGWDVLEKPLQLGVIREWFAKGYNMGAVCGEASNITVLDIDWYRKGIMEMLFKGKSTGKSNVDLAAARK